MNDKKKLKDFDSRVMDLNIPGRVVEFTWEEAKSLGAHEDEALSDQPFPDEDDKTGRNRDGKTL